MGVMLFLLAEDFQGLTGFRPGSLSLPYFTVSLALNVILTLMIAARMFQHSRTIQSAVGAPGTVSELYKAIVSIFVKSCALYTAGVTPFLVSWMKRSSGGGQCRSFSPFTCRNVGT